METLRIRKFDRSIFIVHKKHCDNNLRDRSLYCSNSFRDRSGTLDYKLDNTSHARNDIHSAYRRTVSSPVNLYNQTTKNNIARFLDYLMLSRMGEK